VDVSSNVKLVTSKWEAKVLVRQAFSKGFSKYDKVANLRDRWYKFQKGKTGLWELIKGMLRFGKTTDFAKIAGNEKGYIYFQDFIPNNDHDTRVVVIGDRAFTLRRGVRENDFRASGSGHKSMDKNLFNDETVDLAFEIATKLKTQCVAFDFVFDQGVPKIIEISYGFTSHEFPGFWDRDLNWHDGPVNVPKYMVGTLLQ